MEWIILTGMSGAGKTKALNALEDMGYACVDNMPPKLLPALADLRRGLAAPATVVLDARNIGDSTDATYAIQQLNQRGVTTRVLFLDADDDTLFRRYKETRRSHPLAKPSDASLNDAICRERGKLAPLRDIADFIIDTSGFVPSQLSSRLKEMLAGATNARGLWVRVMSFGFKYGAPQDADIMLDVRCLPNPFYVDELRHLSGLDSSVDEYVMRFDSSRDLLCSFETLFDKYVRLFDIENRAQLTIAIGCTGGRHRSVVFAERLCAHLKGNGVAATVSHRDKDR